jgi:uncharacterized protein YhdP
MFANDYAVTGSWSDPIVERLGRIPATAAAPPATTKQ